jgi:2-amino-4-hydroxy-6-hydroxymethyldihydropteridine diphosphokinase/dihydroneopterin aldolase
MTIPDFGAVRSAAGRPLDQIRLIGVTARGRHGVFAQERRDGQDFTVDVVLHVDTRPAAASDDVTDTVHYGDLAVRIAEVVRGEPVDLIETLAARIAASCLASPDCADVVTVDVAVHKPHAPITEPFTDVVVAIRRDRAELLSVDPGELAGLNQVSGPNGLDQLDRRPNEPVSAVLALGTNLGDREATLRAAVAGLRDVPDLRVDVVSPVVETDPVGGPEQPDFLNAVVLVTTGLTARELLAACQSIEAGQGRERTVHWGPRTLDVDLIRYGDLLSADPVLELPHPRAAQRAFVLAPWLAADPQAWLPSPSGPVPVAPLLADANDRDGLRPRPDVLLDELSVR